MKSSPQDFLVRLGARFPQLEYKMTTFPSGAYMVDVTIQEEAHVIEFLPDLGFGVSRLKTATFGWEGVEHSFATEEEVVDFVGMLVVQARTK